MRLEAGGAGEGETQCFAPSQHSEIPAAAQRHVADGGASKAGQLGAAERGRVAQERAKMAKR